MSSTINLSPKFSKNEPDLNLTSYNDLSNVKLALITSPLISTSKVIGCDIPFIVKTPWTS